MLFLTGVLLLLLGDTLQAEWGRLPHDSSAMKVWGHASLGLAGGLLVVLGALLIPMAVNTILHYVVEQVWKKWVAICHVAMDTYCTSKVLYTVCSFCKLCLKVCPKVSQNLKRDVYYLQEGVMQMFNPSDVIFFLHFKQQAKFSILPTNGSRLWESNVYTQTHSIMYVFTNVQYQILSNLMSLNLLVFSKHLYRLMWTWCIPIGRLFLHNINCS